MDDIIEEIWRDIEGYEDYLQVSNLGRVRKKAHPGTKKKIIEAKILKVYQGGYQIFTTVAGKKLTIDVRDVVASAFLPLPAGCDINDMIIVTLNAKFDCSVANLKWVRKSEANLFTRRLLTEPRPKPVRKQKPGRPPKPVKKKPYIVQLRQNGEYIRRYININELLTVHPTWDKDVILDCLDDYISSAYGWRILYEDDYKNENN